MENGVLKAIVKLNLPAYKDKYDADTKKTHERAGLEGNTHTAFTLKYVNDKWELDGTFPAVVLLVTCNGSHENQTYTVTFNGNGGVPSVIRMATIDQKLPELPTATHSGRYSFDGWYTEKNGGTKITTATLFDKDTTVYAHWTYTGFTGSGGGVTTYPITVLNAKNGTVAASHKTAPKGATITLTVAPDKDFVMDGLAVVDGAGAAIKLTDMGNGKYTFIMPASKVTVEGSFKEEFPDFPNPFSDIAPSDDLLKSKPPGIAPYALLSPVVLHLTVTRFAGMSSSARSSSVIAEPMVEILRGSLFALGWWVAVAFTRAIMVYSVPGLKLVKWQLSCQVSPLSLEYSHLLFSVTLMSVSVLLTSAMVGAAP